MSDLHLGEAVNPAIGSMMQREIIKCKNIREMTDECNLDCLAQANTQVVTPTCFNMSKDKQNAL